MEELIKEIKRAYEESEMAFSHEPMPFDERISAVNQWWSSVTPEKVMRLVNYIEKGDSLRRLKVSQKRFQDAGYKYPAQTSKRHTNIAGSFDENGFAFFLIKSLTAYASSGLLPTYVPSGRAFTLPLFPVIVLLKPMDSIASWSFSYSSLLQSNTSTRAM